MKVSFELNGRVIVRWILGVLFTWAAVSKLPNPQEFYSSIVAYRLPLPGSVLRLAAETLPWLELFCGLLLLARLWYRPALLWVLVLSTVFLVATGQAWARGLPISCGCMNLDFLGSGPQAKTAIKFLESAPFAFFRSMVLLAAGWYLYRGDPDRELTASLTREQAG
jgi:putative oxidoreductase